MTSRAFFVTQRRDSKLLLSCEGAERKGTEEARGGDVLLAHALHVYSDKKLDVTTPFTLLLMQQQHEQRQLQLARLW